MPPSEPPVARASRVMPNCSSNGPWARARSPVVRSREILRARISRSRTARAVAATQQIGREDRAAGGIQRLARFEKRLPPLVYFMASGQRVEHEHPTLLGSQLGIAVGSVAQSGVADGSAAFGAEISQLKIADWRDGGGGKRHASPAFLDTPAAGHRPGVTACSRPFRLVFTSESCPVFTS